MNRFFKINNDKLFTAAGQLLVIWTYTTFTCFVDIISWKINIDLKEFNLITGFVFKGQEVTIIDLVCFPLVLIVNRAIYLAYDSIFKSHYQEFGGIQIYQI